MVSNRSSFAKEEKYLCIFFNCCIWKYCEKNSCVNSAQNYSLLCYLSLDKKQQERVIQRLLADLCVCNEGAVILTDFVC